MSDLDEHIRNALERDNARRTAEREAAASARSERQDIQATWAKLRDDIIEPTLKEARDTFNRSGRTAAVRKEVIAPDGGGEQEISLIVLLGKGREASLTFRHRQNTVATGASGTTRAIIPIHKDSREMTRDDVARAVREFVDAAFG